MKVVLDTNVLVRANPRTSPRGLARELLLTVVSGPNTLVVSPYLLDEIQQVLSYPHVQRRWPLSRESIGNYLAYLEDAALVVELMHPPPAILSDPDDDPILQTAIMGGVDVLCTRDNAFSHPLVLDVCRQHGIRIVDDVALMKELRAYPGM
ncbi:MAG: putative toxin-antitoxin system toxin component, PIN family [Bryobacteraceae bacterium]